MYLQKLLIVTLIVSFFSYSAFSEDGKTLFKGNCAACHSIGKGRLVGPDLKYINDMRSEAWLLKWIKSSQSFIKSGDADAVAIYNEYNKIPMTDFSFLSDEQIKTILTYIKEEGAVPAVASTPVVAVAASEQSNQATNENGWISFSTAEYFLISLVLLLLFIVIMLSRIIKKLSEQLMDSYDSKRSFF